LIRLPRDGGIERRSDLPHRSAITAPRNTAMIETKLRSYCVKLTTRFSRQAATARKPISGA
jgi:hypothetical protein